MEKKKTENEKKIHCKKARVAQRTYQSQQSPDKKEAERVANKESMMKRQQKSAGLLMIPAVGGHGSGETVTAEFATIVTSGGVASREKTCVGWSEITGLVETALGESTSPSCLHAGHTLPGGSEDTCIDGAAFPRSWGAYERGDGKR